MQLSGNTVLITGGTSGIGLAFAKELMQAGSTVIICGRREHRLEEIKQQYPDIITKVTDVTVDSDREELADWVVKNHPAINILINNAGVQLKTDLTKPVDLSRVRSEVETNLVAPIHLASLLVQHLMGKQNGAIINISSGLAFVPLAFMPVYCATKAAIHSLTLSLRYQLKDSYIKVFEIAPPAVDTELGHDRREDKNQSHGGMPVQQFIEAVMKAIEEDVLEAPIGTSVNSRAKREELFEWMNDNVKG
jgi:uncharacterized oxidoreductase